MPTKSFHPYDPLILESVHPSCRAIVIVPARNEESSLPRTLDALRDQVDLRGRKLSPHSFEVLLLLNNCTDASAQVANGWKANNSHVALHIVERTIPPPQAHVGTARRWLMDTAWHRLRDTSGVRGILSTDSDSVVAPDWIARTLLALKRGADAVGGQIRLKAGEVESLPDGARRAYWLDRRYQRLVARLESLLDPFAHDPWPRHLEHFGASLACTPEAYARSGGMPAVCPLEDVAFTTELLEVGARLRHDPDVVVYTSARLDGRAEIGLSHQLRTWQGWSDEGRDHIVPSLEWTAFRCRMRRAMRVTSTRQSSELLSFAPEAIRQQIVNARRQRRSLLQVLGREPCERLIDNHFTGQRLVPIAQANRDLLLAIRSLVSRNSVPAIPSRQGGTRLDQRGVPASPDGNHQVALV